VLEYDRLLLATGSAAMPLGLPGDHLEGVVKLDDMSDARDLINRCRKAKTAVVVGGGITALEIVEGLRAHKVHVHYLMRRDRYWASVLSECESNIVEDGLESRGVDVHRFAEIAEVLGRDGKVVGVRTTKGERIDCDLVGVAIGVVPQIELARSAGLDCERGLLVDEYLRTSAKDVFAAGDVAEVCVAETDRRTLDVLWNAAVAKGRIAGLNMADEVLHRYEESVPLNVTRLAGFKITIIGTVGGGVDSDVAGIARGDSQAWRELGDAVTVELQSGEAHIRLALGEKTIVGAVITGDQQLSFALQELIDAQADVSSILARVEAPGAPVAQIVSDFWDGWKASRV
jgi:NAD(P)H-nitrite reductase large subunit